jgi:O-antigen biosynthesis protein WbqP
MLHQKLIKIMRNLICIAGLLCIAPFLLIAALILVLEDGLPIFFIQNRVGQNKEIFKIFKIRTLKNCTPNTGTHELEAKHRLKIGVVIRKMKLDEFPQLLNVIKGDINLVGPRPGLPNQARLLKDRSDRKIFKIKPGITGLAQVMGYDMSSPEKLSTVDEMYVNNKSFWIDVLILIATFANFPKHYLSQHFKIEDISGFK